MLPTREPLQLRLYAPAISGCRGFRHPSGAGTSNRRKVNRHKAEKAAARGQERHREREGLRLELEEFLSETT